LIAPPGLFLISSMKSTTVARLVLIAEVFKGANRCRTRRTDPCEIRAKLLGQSAVAVDHLRRPVDGNLCAARGIAGEVDPAIHWSGWFSSRASFRSAHMMATDVASMPTFKPKRFLI
jgi:hypothetical protein